MTRWTRSVLPPVLARESASTEPAQWSWPPGLRCSCRIGGMTAVGDVIRGYRLVAWVSAATSVSHSGGSDGYRYRPAMAIKVSGSPPRRCSSSRRPAVDSSVQKWLGWERIVRTINGLGRYEPRARSPGNDAQGESGRVRLAPLPYPATGWSLGDLVAPCRRAEKPQGSTRIL